MENTKNIDLINKFTYAAKRVADEYAKLSNVVSVVIGGSLARGFTDNVSDIEMYVYYQDSLPTKEEINNILKKLDANLTRSKNVHWYYPAWGYHTFFGFDGIKFELGYRETEKIKKRMTKFREKLTMPAYGIHDTPFGHYESGVASCIIDCQILYDPKEYIRDMKLFLSNYRGSILFKETLDYYLTDAETIINAKLQYAARRNDHYNFNASLARAIRSLVITLFTLNGVYYPGDKWNERYMSKFDMKPEDFDNRMKKIFSTADYEKESKLQKYVEIAQLVVETKELLEKVK